jgi:hypothetical protein
MAIAHSSNAVRIRCWMLASRNAWRPCVERNSLHSAPSINFHQRERASREGHIRGRVKQRSVRSSGRQTKRTGSNSSGATGDQVCSAIQRQPSRGRLAFNRSCYAMSSIIASAQSMCPSKPSECAIAR